MNTDLRFRDPPCAAEGCDEKPTGTEPAVLLWSVPSVDFRVEVLITMSLCAEHCALARVAAVA